MVERGIAQTIRSEVRSAIPASLIGWGWGVVVGEPTKHAKEGFIIGTIYGWEKAFLDYNKEAVGKGLPQTEWYDWVAANLLNALLLARGNTPKTLLQTFVVAQFLNPITISAARHKIQSFLQ